MIRVRDRSKGSCERARPVIVWPVFRPGVVVHRAILIVANTPITQADLKLLDEDRFRRNHSLGWNLHDYTDRKIGITVPLTQVVRADIMKLDAVVVKDLGWFPTYDMRADVSWLQSRGRYGTLVLMRR